MDPKIIVGIIAVCIALASFFTVIYIIYTSRNGSGSILSSVSMGGSTTRLSSSQVREKLSDDASGKEFDRIKKITKNRVRKKEKVTLEEKFFHAGVFSDKDKRELARIRIFAPIILTGIMVGLCYNFSLGVDMISCGVVLGIIAGLALPNIILDRKIKERQGDILYYLPLVIEQISIGVSSSLDVGPCVQKVVSMADERDSHNVVTELMRHVEHFIKSGASLDLALNEVGKMSGSSELKHAFSALAQVARHGGEISKQLQELADSVSSQRESKIEAKIKKLELEATGPVALVFAGFLIILMIGFGLQMKGAF